MLLFDPHLRRRHLQWLIFCLIVTGLAVAFYFWFAVDRARWPGGSSLPGLVFGVLSALIIVFEFALWPRKWKRVRAVRFLGRTQTWMMAHLWLGLVSIPLVWLHSGFRWGGGLSATLAALYVAVIASGVFGLVLQNVIPRRLLNEVPAETIYSQIPHVCRLLVEDSDDLVDAVCGREPELNKRVTLPFEELPPLVLRIGAVRGMGRFQGTAVCARPRDSQIPGGELVRDVYRRKIRPFLADGSGRFDELSHEDGAGKYFGELRTRLHPRTHDVLGVLEEACSQRRQLDRQARLHWWLHGWLSIHLPLSVALLILLAAHTFYATKYW